MHRFLLLSALLLSTFVALPASAQLLVGPRLGYDVDVEELFLGGELRTGLGSLPIDAQISADYFLVDPGTLLQFEFNALYDITGGAGEALTPYVGAGLALAYRSVGDYDDTEAGLNLVAGARFNTASAVTPFVQARMTVDDGTRVAAAGGILFTLGR